jgi:hypothetical protein
MITVKYCSKCRKNKLLSEFHSDKSNKDGLRYICKPCDNLKSKKYEDEQREKYGKPKRCFYTNSILKMKKCRVCKEIKTFSDFFSDKSRKDGLANLCKVCAKVKRKEYRDIHIFQCRENEKNYRTKHPRKNQRNNKELIRKWKNENSGKMLEYKRKFYSTPKGKLSRCMSFRIWKTLKNNSKGKRKWESLVGYTVEQLKKHLEKKFTPEMTWENQGSYWHIDHKIPVSVFNFNCPEHIDFKKCWALENLQPMEAIKNKIKGKKIEKSFQPSLAIAV